MGNRRYNEDFKQSIVKLLNSEKLVSKLSKQYGISKSAIYAWSKQYYSLSTETEESPMIHFSEIQQENLRLKQDVEILKQAMSIIVNK